jgi:TRAP-type C4-dicarboxylate transport system permease small subunit
MAKNMAGTSREINVRREESSGALVSLICLAVFAVVFTVYTTRYLPDRVATHFGAGGQANGWMSRDGYLLFMLAFMVGISSLVSFLVGTLPRKYPQWTNVPNRDYWLAPARRDESLGYLATHGKRLGALIVMMMLGMHYVILKANAVQPPTLPGATFSAVLFGFALALIWWIVRLYRRFPKQASQQKR